jgi:hypothetical protein
MGDRLGTTIFTDFTLHFMAIKSNAFTTYPFPPPLLARIGHQPPTLLLVVLLSLIPHIHCLTVFILTLKLEIAYTPKRHLQNPAITEYVTKNLENMLIATTTKQHKEKEYKTYNVKIV